MYLGHACRARHAVAHGDRPCGPLQHRCPRLQQRVLPGGQYLHVDDGGRVAAQAFHHHLETRAVGHQQCARGHAADERYGGNSDPAARNLWLQRDAAQVGAALAQAPVAALRRGAGQQAVFGQRHFARR